MFRILKKNEIFTDLFSVFVIILTYYFCILYFRLTLLDVSAILEFSYNGTFRDIYYTGEAVKDFALYGVSFNS